MEEFGVVYCATGWKYAHLAHSSIESFFSQGGSSKVEVFTDDTGSDFFSRRVFAGDVIVRRLSEPALGFIDKIAALENTSFTRGVFVDCDTFFPAYQDHKAAKTFQSDVSRLVDDFDLVALPGLSLNTLRELEVCSAALGQWNTGVIGFKKSEMFSDFLSSWRENYRAEDPHDQPSFRMALTMSRLRVAPLMLEYNFQGHGPLNARPLLFHLTGNYRKNWMGYPPLIQAITRTMEEENYPACFIEFQKVSPLPSKLTKTMGPNFGFFVRGIWKWLITRFDIFFFSQKYHRAL